MLIFDCETDGFYESVSKVHCLVIKDTESGMTWVYSSQAGPGELTIDMGLLTLQAADHICGHNVLKYDIPVLQKLFPWFKPQGKVLDTLILARLAKPEVGDDDDKLIARGKLQPKYRGSHALEPWGFRLGVLKGTFDGPWDQWTQEMQDYCVQDVVVTETLLKHLQSYKVAPMALCLEHEVARIVSRQECYGIHFNEVAARELLVRLSKERLELAEDLKARFGYWFARDGGKVFYPKKDDRKRGYMAGVPLSKIKPVYFNPGSRHHIARILIRNFGWMPTTYTPTGEPEVSEESLKPIKHPEAASLVQYLTVVKRLGQLAEGKENWLDRCRNGKIHGGVNTIGAVTRRMSHAGPNLAQVPAVRSPYGTECRALFHAAPGRVLVGIDAAALELRILAHYMARFDGGAYVRTVIEGRKEDGTEIHTVNRKALQIDSRDDAKTWFYAFIYGAGNEKLGRIVTKQHKKSANVKLGKQLRERFLTNLPAMGKLLGEIKAKVDAGRPLMSIDSHPLHCRSSHSAPNTLFQSTGAVVMKLALVIFDNSLQQRGYVPGIDYEFVLNVHDEWQVESRPELAEEVGQLGVAAIRDAGDLYGLRCPLDGEYRVGFTWADTH